MNSKEMRKINDKKNSINRKINILKSFVDEFEENKENLMDRCNDDIVVLYVNYLNKVYSNIKYGKCLICGKTIGLDNDNFDIINNKNINVENIIDISNNEPIINAKDIVDNKLFNEIENKFNELINSKIIYSKEEIIKELRKLVNVKKLNKIL